MDKLITACRAAQLYAHNAHNVTSGKTFGQDHAHFAELYEAYEAAYDDLVERVIGLNNESLDLVKIQADAADKVTAPSYPEKMFETLLATELDLIKLIEAANKKASLGTQNILQQLADDCEKRIYKLRQRVG